MCDKVSSDPATNHLDVLLRGSEVARILNISRSQAYALIQRGELPSIRLGSRAVRVTPTDLEAFIAQRRWTCG